MLVLSCFVGVKVRAIMHLHVPELVIHIVTDRHCTLFRAENGFALPALLVPLEKAFLFLLLNLIRSKILYF